MKKALLLFLGISVVSLAVLFWPKPGGCLICPTYTCYSSSGCAGCSCLRGPGETSGQCFTTRKMEGYTLLE